MNRLQYFLQRHSTTILAVVASGGVIATTILAVKATPKAIKLLEEAEDKKGEQLTNIEKIKVGFEPYIPTVLMGISTIATIGGLEYLNHKKQVSIASAYTMLLNGYNEYKNVLLNRQNDPENLQLSDIIATKFANSGIDLQDGEELFFDYTSLRFFTSTYDDVMEAGKQAIEGLQTRGYLCINEWYDLLGIDAIDWGYQLGWSDLEENDPYNCKEMEFTYEKVNVGTPDIEIPCWVIVPTMPASFDYII